MAGKKQTPIGLTENEKRFCDEFLVDYNGTRAAIRAGYSKKSACSQASRLLTKAKVQQYLTQKKQKVADKLEITMERTLNEIGRIAFQDPRRLFNADGTFKSIHELDDDTAAVLSGTEIEESFTEKNKVKLSTGRNIKLKFWPKDKALEMLAKHFKIYSDAPVVNNKVETYDLSKYTDEELRTIAELQRKGGTGQA